MIIKKSTYINKLVLTVLFCAAGTVTAGDVKMFSEQPPSAEEMGNILFSNKASLTQVKPRIKTRSISFGKPKDITATSVNQGQKNVAASAASADTIGLPIKFGYNSVKILDESKPFLNEVGKMLSLNQFADKKLVIEGHTDASGSDDYNRYLSERRAQAVKDYLVGKFQIASNRLFITGKGESAPLKGKSPYDGVNRRVQFYQAP